MSKSTYAIIIIAIWTLASVGVQIMRKVAPYDKVYPWWVLFVSIMSSLVIFQLGLGCF